MKFINDFFCSLSFSKKALNQLKQKDLKYYFIYFAIIQLMCVVIRLSITEIELLLLLKISGYGFLKLMYFILFMTCLCKWSFKHWFFHPILKATIIITFFSLFSICFINFEYIYKIVNVVCAIYAFVYYYFFLTKNLNLEKRNAGILGVLILASNVCSKIVSYSTILLINTIRKSL